MESIYHQHHHQQSNHLYNNTNNSTSSTTTTTTSLPPYVLPQHDSPYSQHYQQQQQYRSSAFSDARSSSPPSYSAGLNNTASSYSHHEDYHFNNNYHNSSPPPSIHSSRNNSYSYNSSNANLPHMPSPMQRPKLTTTVWEDEGTLCYQVDAKSVCVARRQDNDMINGTKLLNVVGMSRGKRDGILKNEKGRVVVKVGAMHLKGVWITFTRAKDLATKFRITDILYPLFVDDPSVFLSVIPPPLPPTSTNAGVLPIMLPSSTSNQRNSSYLFNIQNNVWDKPYQSPLPSIHQQDMLIRSQQQPHQQSGSVSPVPGNILANEDNDNLYLLNNSASAPSNTYDYHRNNRTYSPYHHLYNNSDYPSSTSSPYDHAYLPPPQKDKQEDLIAEKRNSIDFPSSPPPESSSNLKYSSWEEDSNKLIAARNDNATVNRQPLEQAQQKRKRGFETTVDRRKRVKGAASTESP